MFFFDSEDGALDLEGQLVGLPTGCAAAVVEGIQTAMLIAIEDLVAGDPGDVERPAQGRHSSAVQQAGNESQAFMRRFTLFPGIWALPKCVNVSTMSPE